VDTLVVRVQPRLAYGALGLAAVLAGIAVLSDPAGRVLTVPGVVCALVLGLRDVRRGPILEADAAGVRVRDGWRRVAAPWADVERMRVLRDRRTELLELDLGRTVVVVSRARLGRLPEDVLTDLQAVRRSQPVSAAVRATTATASTTPTPTQAAACTRDWPGPRGT
jgi:hypothetical protein